MEQKTLSETEEEFKNSISIPDKKSARQFFFCPVGLVGTGKTTITKPISERFGLVRISSDELRKMLKENGHTYDSVKDIGLRVVRDFAARGYGVAFDMDCGNPTTKEFAENLGKELGVLVIFVHVTAPEEFIFEKFKKHPPTWLADNPQKMIDNHLAQKKLRLEQNAKFDFLYTFDTSKTDLKMQISECCEKIEAKLG